jgi:hypothetical protein
MMRTRRSQFCSAIITIGVIFSGSAPMAPPAISPSEPRIEVSGVRNS